MALGTGTLDENLHAAFLDSVFYRGEVEGLDELASIIEVRPDASAFRVEVESVEGAAEAVVVQASAVPEVRTLMRAERIEDAELAAGIRFGNELFIGDAIPVQLARCDVLQRVQVFPAPVLR